MFRDQINTVKMLETKLKYSVNDNDQIYSLLFKEILCVKILIEDSN